MEAVTITQITYPELENLIEKSLLKILSVKQPVNSQSNRTKKVLNINDAVTLTHLSKSRIYVLASAGTIPNFKKGTRVLFYEDELLSWLESGKRMTQEQMELAADNSLVQKQTA